MFKHNKKLYISLSVILIFLVFFIIFSFKKENSVSDSALSPISTTKNTESVTILVGKTITHLLLPSKTLLYDALMQEKKLGKITFSGKNYPGLGFFMTDIGTLHTGNGKNLLYYVNGKQASVGVSAYILKDGDVIEWKLE